jgi:GT2 family glycosyltransferase
MSAPPRVLDVRGGDHWRRGAAALPPHHAETGAAAWLRRGWVIPFAWLAIGAGWLVARLLAAAERPRATASAAAPPLPAAPFADEPAVSVVIPFFNRRAEVAPCLAAVLAQRLPAGSSFEVIAVDNGSTDGTREALAAAPVVLAECAVRGPAAARNAGWRRARAPIVAFIDSDCIAEPGWLAALVAPFADPQVRIVGGGLAGHPPATGPEAFFEGARILDPERFFSGIICFPPFFPTANMAIRRDDLEATGGFDESLRAGEDADLCWRTMERDGRMALVPEARVLHAHRADIRALWRQATGYGTGAAAIFAKHRARLGLARVMLWDDWAALAALPWRAAWALATGRGRWQRIVLLYQLVWESAFAIGKLRGPRGLR